MLYEKYRPTIFEEVIGQGITPEILRRQVENGTIGHSYLLAGNRGSGKTTTARIFAKAVNCHNPKNGEPCGECESCKAFDNGIHVDITEIDAASNNGVDNVRSLITDMQYGPQMSKYKVYIIDEAHMLTPGASNAFLKTLEEPPKYVILILATTDPHKLPITVLSRCQRFDFRRISNDIIEKRILEVTKKENKDIDIKSASLLANLADGAMRDALSLLEQSFSLGDKITYKDVSNLLGIAKNEVLFELLENIVQRNTLEALEGLSNIISSGKDINIIFQEFLKINRDLLMAKTNKENCEKLIIASDEEIEAFKDLSKHISSEGILRNIRVLQELERDIKFSSNANIVFETAIIRMCKSMENDIEGLYELLHSIDKKLKCGSYLSSDKEEDYKVIENDDKPFGKVEYKDSKMNSNTIDEEDSYYGRDDNKEDNDYDNTGEDDEKYILDESIDKVIEKLRKIMRDDIADILDMCAYEVNGDYLIIETNKKSEKEEIEIVKNTLCDGFSKYLKRKIKIKVM